MPELETALSYTLSGKAKDGIPVIIVAAGSSSRMNGTNKILTELKGVPVIARTMLAFESSETVSDIIVVARDEDKEKISLIADKYCISKLKKIVPGGKNRQESVKNGLAELEENDLNVLIHDGARPFVSQTIIKDVADALENRSCAVCAVPLKDTVKKVDEKGVVTATLPRQELCAVQTPQGVRKADYFKALEKLTSFIGITDDASVMEAAGYEVITVKGSYKNIKLTTPEDLLMGEILCENTEEP